MADRCNIHRGCGRRYRDRLDFLGISDTDVNRNVYPDRNLPCDEHVAGIGEKTFDCVCRERDDGRGTGGVDFDRDYGRRGRRRSNNCLCDFVRCICGGRRRRRDRGC